MPLPQLSKVEACASRLAEITPLINSIHFSNWFFPTSKTGPNRKRLQPPYTSVYTENPFCWLLLFSALNVFVPKSLDRETNGWFSRLSMEEDGDNKGNSRVLGRARKGSYYFTVLLHRILLLVVSRQLSVWGQGVERGRSPRTILLKFAICKLYFKIMP